MIFGCIGGTDLDPERERRQQATEDSSFSYRQDQVARLGDRARPWGVTRTIRTTSESRAECVYFLPVFASD